MSFTFSTIRKFLEYKHFVAAGVLTIIGIFNFQSLTEKNRWPQVDALVVESSFTPSPSDSRKASLSFSYRYQAAGRTRMASAIYASLFQSKPEYLSEVQEVVTRYPKGAKIMAHLNPDALYESYIDLSPSIIDYALPGAGAVGLLCFSLYGYAKKIKKQPQTSADEYNVRQSTTLRLDLRCEFDEIYAYLVERVRRFDPSSNDGPGKGGPVSLIEVGFEYAQSAWVVVVFDTRQDVEPDGEWTLHIEGQDLSRPLWLKAGEHQLEHSLALVQLDGKEAVIAPGTELAGPLGDLLNSVLLKARSDGVFSKLPMTAGCKISIEHQSGAGGWPLFDARQRK